MCHAVRKIGRQREREKGKKRSKKKGSEMKRKKEINSEEIAPIIWDYVYVFI